MNNATWINPALEKNFTAIKARIAETDAAFCEDIVLDELARELSGMDEFTASAGLWSRLDRLCREIAPPPPELPTPRKERPHWVRKGLAVETFVTGHRLTVNADFYDAELADGEIELTVYDGAVCATGKTWLCADLANLVVKAYDGDDCLTVRQIRKPRDGFDLRRENLTVVYIEEQRARRRWLEKEAERNFQKPNRMFQLNGKMLIPSDNIENMQDAASTTADLTAKPVRPKASAPDGNDNQRPDATAPRAPVIDDRLQHVPFQREPNLLKPIKQPKTTLGKNGKTGKGVVKRTTPPYAAKWIDGEPTC